MNWVGSRKSNLLQLNLIGIDPRIFHCVFVLLLLLVFETCSLVSLEANDALEQLDYFLHYKVIHGLHSKEGM